jgi:hypothetical protein
MMMMMMMMMMMLVMMMMTPVTGQLLRSGALGEAAGGRLEHQPIISDVDDDVDDDSDDESDDVGDDNDDARDRPTPPERCSGRTCRGAARAPT